MKKTGFLHRGLTLIVLTLGLLLIFPQVQMYANASDNGEPGTTEQTDGTAGASQETDGTTGASVQKFEHYEPLPIEPIQREANNGLLGGGIAVAALIIGGAIVMDKRNGI